MDASSFSLALGDGRSVDVEVSGPDGGTPLLLLHGTPSVGQPYPPLAEAAAARGLRLVGYSRPGYGDSPRQPGRDVAACAPDTAAIADRLGADRFYVAGTSGGGPHALACAALLPDRVLACATVAGAAPYDAEGLDFLDGMARENHEEFGAAVAGETALRDYLERQLPELVKVTGEQVAAAFGDLVSPIDAATLTGDFADHLAGSVRRAVANGVWGWLDDDLAFVRPWGFELAGIRVPVFVWQGGQDRMVPFSHGEWLAAHVPGATARLLPDQGHLSIATSRFGEIVDELIASAPPPGG
jgi:pimeloyl-ACP methyl ester carboxylesterase